MKIRCDQYFHTLFPKRLTPGYHYILFEHFEKPKIGWQAVEKELRIIPEIAFMGVPFTNHGPA
jgi:hypothetical protein